MIQIGQLLVIDKYEYMKYLPRGNKTIMLNLTEYVI